MPDLLWDDVREWFEPDGSLLDAYVLETTVADWQAFVDLVRSTGWWFTYSEDNRPRRLPHRVESVLARRGEMAVLLQIRPVPEIRVNVHFFTDEEIEVDFSRENCRARNGSMCCAASFEQSAGGWASPWCSRLKTPLSTR